MTDPGRAGTRTPGKLSSLNRHANTQEVAKEKEELVQGEARPWTTRSWRQPVAGEGAQSSVCERVLLVSQCCGGFL